MSKRYKKKVIFSLVLVFGCNQGSGTKSQNLNSNANALEPSVGQKIDSDSSTTSKTPNTESPFQSRFFPLRPPTFEELMEASPTYRANFSAAVGMSVSSSDLIDVKGHPYSAEIQETVSKGLMSGYEDKTFKPSGSLKREEMAAILFQTLRRLPGPQLSTPAGLTDSPFADVSVKRWSVGVIALATNLGILKGYEQGKGQKNLFRPEKPLTRAELMAILRAVTLYVRKQGGLSPAESPLFQSGRPSTEFTDIPSNHWAKGVISDMARYCGVAHVADKKGGTSFGPDTQATRGFELVLLSGRSDREKKEKRIVYEKKKS